MATTRQCPVHDVAPSTAYRYRKCRCDVCGPAHAERQRRKYATRREQYRASQREYYEANKGEIAATQARWRRENPEKMEEYRRQWAERNPDADREAKRRWKRRNRAAVNAEARRRRARDPSRHRRADKKWREANPDRVALHHALRHARKREAPGDCTPTQLQARIEFYGGRCYLCGDPYEAIDHVIALANGGSNWPANLRPICTTCNSRKGARPLSEVAA